MEDYQNICNKRRKYTVLEKLMIITAKLMLNSSTTINFG